VRLILLVASICLSFAAAEGLLWLFGYDTFHAPAKAPTLLYNKDFVPDPDLGWKATRKIDRSEAIGSGRRVLFLGDSVVYGLKVGNEKSFPGDFAKMNKGVEVYNFAVPGYGPDQYLISYELRARLIKADLVYVGVTLCNDVGNDAFDEQYGVKKPQFDLLNGRLVLVSSPRWRNKKEVPEVVRFKWIRSHSRSANLIWTLLYPHPNVEAHMSRFSIDPSPAYNRALDVTIAILYRLKDEIEADGGRAVFMLLPYMKMYEDERHRSNPLRSRLLRDSSLEVVDLFDSFSPYSNLGSLFVDEFHYSECGNEAIAINLSSDFRKKYLSARNLSQ